MSQNNTTVEFYNRNAFRFVKETECIDMESLYEPFLHCLFPGAKILDAGCGSGRDAAAFLKLGYEVFAFDASEKMCELARQRTGIDVKKMNFEEFHHQNFYDGIWACASLLHLPIEAQHKVIEEFLKSLSPDGVFYASWKHGNKTYNKDGRFFCDMDSNTLQQVFAKHSDANILKIWETPDFRKVSDAQKNWINILVRKTHQKENRWF